MCHPSKKYETALEFIETGRGVFWSQALQLRTPVDQLQAVDPDLAQKLRDVSRALEAGALRDVSKDADEPEEHIISWGEASGSLPQAGCRLGGAPRPDSGTRWFSRLYAAEDILLPLRSGEKSDSPPRIWWLPTGPFTSLPLHAAGVFDGEQDQREFVGDYVVSSYIPTINALLVPPSQSALAALKMLAVIQPNAPGQRPLKAVGEELSRIEKRVSSSVLQSYGISGRPAHVENVVAQLPTASIVHFACHGVQNPYNPLDSALLLEEQLKVTRLMELQIPHASLVFLSACQTAMGDDRLPDEAMHLAATLLFAGYRSAVATLWSIQDEDGPTVADSFYEYLTRKQEDHLQGVPQVAQAAYALHTAVRKLRDDRCSFVRWIPFIHMGL
ncbi:hypothetical protein EVG20_g10832 [Dentipellis fragilis]|uniref:CHAT domain-containing protein n=1 Tax=Dentipellis fragilis TaxID=205917 RepID=A0A4Y9XNX2_9AGAM|nr:hypothetical protein EVG20_g10832 [Dentipellis fragilis]